MSRVLHGIKRIAIIVHNHKHLPQIDTKIVLGELKDPRIDDLRIVMKSQNDLRGVEDD